MATSSELPDGTVSVVVSEGVRIYVKPRAGGMPPRVDFHSPGRYSPLVPVDVLRRFAEQLDPDDRRMLLDLLDSLTPARR